MNIFSYLKELFGKSKTTSKDILQIQREGAELAVEKAKVYNLKLNYTDKSIETVEKILRIIGKEYSLNSRNTDIGGLSIIFGLYIIEVIERNHEKGFLQRKLLGTEHDDFPYYWKGNLIFPCNWVQNKIKNMSSTDISLIYNNVILEKVHSS